MKTTIYSAATASPATANLPSLNYRQLALVGTGVWAIATVILRQWGQLFFIPTSSWMMGLCFLAFLVISPLIAFGVIRGLSIPLPQRPAAVLGLALPGLLLDALTTYWFPYLFPNLAPSAAGPFGAWLLWGYAVLLLTGLLLSQEEHARQGQESHRVSAG